MNMPFYVPPEQMMRDRADFAQKGIARGRSLVTIECADGIVLCAENPSRNLRKISEIYDRIAFAGVGKYNEYDQLRIAGIRAADLRGYTYSRDDVDAQTLANQYAQMMSQVFTHDVKPMEVEILVASVGATGADDRMFHIRYDGSVTDEDGFAALGGDAERIREALDGVDTSSMALSEALKLAVEALSGEEPLTADQLEVGFLDRGGEGRCYRRLDNDEIAELLQ
ncbi:MAG: proteasome subunit alpha [Acidimicrobiales bacterium]|nr:proteasome subunit alpha [Acidimicrobiales bacterium]